MDISSASVRVMEEGLSIEFKESPTPVSATSTSKSQSALSDNQKGRLGGIQYIDRTECLFHADGRHRSVWQIFSLTLFAVVKAVRPKARNKASEVVVRQCERYIQVKYHTVADCASQ